MGPLDVRYSGCWMLLGSFTPIAENSGLVDPSTSHDALLGAYLPHLGDVVARRTWELFKTVLLIHKFGRDLRRFEDLMGEGLFGESE